MKKLKKFIASGHFSIEFLAEDEEDATWRLKHVHFQDASVDMQSLHEKKACIRCNGRGEIQVDVAPYEKWVECPECRGMIRDANDLVELIVKTESIVKIDGTNPCPDCDKELEWNDDVQIYHCPQCGYEF